MKRWKVVLSLLGAILFIFLSYSIYLYIEIRSTFDTIHEPLWITPKATDNGQQTSVNYSANSNAPSNEVPIQPQLHNNTPSSPITVLLLGIDNWESTTGRADTILLLTLNPNDSTMKILSIPRDTYTEIVGFDFEDKINHSYAFGGVETTLSTVETLMDIPIDYVVTVNMEGFIEMVDIVGGVDVYNDMSFSNNSFEYPEGNLTLSGDEALSYVRMRKEDPRGDFGRQMRQRQVLESIFNKVASINLIWQAPSILKTIREHVQTNLTFDEMIEFQSVYKSTLNDIEHLHFSKGEGGLQNGIWYYFLNDEELQEMRETLQHSLL
ncbi:LCP family glycopolymer transferase [Ureibacillus manganicus]|uniref:Cell envelope-related transcriptional attenuator domain-containing protein n=1 Tax=Ureibacillus manganicus DSM 26584 TaxID=1384049 RepID=A0A0A3I9D9_9BACL|nr:LCP family protein [Ureibacillus manganicus]KGR80120.1 hypothetical protein CD29_01805 [Ureibacillus manganicus DSM 26584]